MIHVFVNLALQLLDGFTGKPLSASAVKMTLDREKAEVIFKPEGWAILANLPEGAHELVIEGAGYQTVTMSVPGGAKSRESVLRMRPDESYRFGRRVTTLHLHVTKRGKDVCGQPVYLLIDDARQALRISQDMVSKGDVEVRMFASGKLTQLPIPGPFYLENSGKAVDNPGELVEILGEKGGVYRLSEGLDGAYRRGCKLVPVESYCTDDTGKAFLTLRGGSSVRVLCENTIHTIGIEELAHNEAQIKL